MSPRTLFSKGVFSRAERGNRSDTGVLPITATTTLISETSSSSTYQDNINLSEDTKTRPLLLSLLDSFWPLRQPQQQQLRQQQQQQQQQRSNHNHHHIRGGGTASVAAQVMNLSKQIVGAGVLGLPSGIAALGNHPSSLWPATFLICTIGIISAYGFALVGRICHQTGAKSYREAWMRTVGEDSSWIPAWACVLVATSSAITLSMVLAETIPDLLQPLLGFVLPRNTALLFITTFALLPMCLLKELSSLAPLSLIGMVAMVYTALVMVQRYSWGYYSDQESPFVQELRDEFVPRFGSDGGWEALRSPRHCATLVSMLSMAFLAHYNAPKFYWDLHHNTLPRYDRVVATSFFASMLLMSTVAFAGFATFGAASQGLILNNYALHDGFMSASRAAVALSVLFSFPLAFVGAKDGLLDLWHGPVVLSRQPQLQRRGGGAAAAATGRGGDKSISSEVVTISLLVFISLATLLIQDIKILMSLGGATWGNCIIYIFPGVMMIRGVSKYPELISHLIPATLTVCLGILLALVGLEQVLTTTLLTSSL